jgi:hypothetical protein
LKPSLKASGLFSTFISHLLLLLPLLLLLLLHLHHPFWLLLLQALLYLQFSARAFVLHIMN